MKNKNRNNVIMQCGKCKSEIYMQKPICPNCGEDNRKMRMFIRQVDDYHKIRCANIALIFVACLLCVLMIALFIQPNIFGVKQSTIDNILAWSTGNNKGFNEMNKLIKPKDSPKENQQSNGSDQNDTTANVEKRLSAEDSDNSFIIAETSTIVKYLLLPNEVYNIDLNQDGIKEQVEVKAYDMNDIDITQQVCGIYKGKNSEELLNSHDFDSLWDYSLLGGKIEVIINGSVSYICDGDDMLSYVIVTDIDKSKAGYDLLISDLGPSVDFFTSIISYDDCDIQKLGDVYDIPISTLKIDGSGKMTGTRRTWFVYTWERPVEYEIKDNKIYEVEKDKYEMNVQGTMVDDMKIYSSPSFDEVVKKLYEDEKVTLLYSDAKNWCYVQAEDGECGYCKVDDGYIEAITGLPMYD